MDDAEPIYSSGGDLIILNLRIIELVILNIF